MAKYMPNPEEDDDATYMPKPATPKPSGSKANFGPAFSRNSGGAKVKAKYRKLALKNKIKGNKSAHQMHMDHVNHVTHTQNEYRRNLNSKNPYNK